MTDQGLWDWALAAYAREGVSEACLSLQDEYGQNVCLLLFAAWCARTGRRLDDETLEAAADAARAWDQAAVQPLRAVRRRLKSPVPDMEDVTRLAARQAVKAAELAAERGLLSDLEALGPTPTGAPSSDPTPALAQAARAWSRVVPRPALETLAGRL